jgi:hypothetical protein
VSCHADLHVVDSEEDGLHGAKGGVGQAAAHAFGFIARHVEMLVVEEALEFEVIGLDLRLGDAAKEAMPLSKLQRVAQHVQLGECILPSLSTPVLLDIVDCGAPLLDFLCCPVALVQQMIVQLLQPAGEDGVCRPCSSIDFASICAHRTDTKRMGSVTYAPFANVPVSVACEMATCCLHAMIVCSQGMCSEGTVRMRSRSAVVRCSSSAREGAGEEWMTASGQPTCCSTCATAARSSFLRLYCCVGCRVS